MLEKIAELFADLKAKYDLKSIPEEVIEQFVKVLNTKLLGAITDIGGSPYPQENCQRDLDALIAKESLDENEMKQKTQIENQMKQNQENVDRKYGEIEYYIQLIKEVKSINL